MKISLPRRGTPILHRRKGRLHTSDFPETRMGIAKISNRKHLLFLQAHRKRLFGEA